MNRPFCVTCILVYILGVYVGGVYTNGISEMSTLTKAVKAGLEILEEFQQQQDEVTLTVALHSGSQSIAMETFSVDVGCYFRCFDVWFDE